MELGLDHLGFLIDSLDSTAEALTSAGFRLTPPVQLVRGDGEPSGGVQQTFGTSRGYVEVQQLTMIGVGHPLERLWTHRPVVAVVAWRAPNLPRALAAASAVGLTHSEPARWSRETDRGTAEFSFASIDPRDPSPTSPVHVFVHHHHPELVSSFDDQRNTMRAVSGYRSNGRLVTSLDLGTGFDAGTMGPVDTVIIEADDADVLADGLVRSGLASSMPATESLDDVPDGTVVVDGRARLGTYVEVRP